MRPVDIGGSELEPRDALPCTESTAVILDEVRHWDEMCLREVTCDAERSTHVLAMDHHMHESGDRPSAIRHSAAVCRVAEGLQYAHWILLASCLPIGRHPPVEVESVAKHSGNDRANSESTLRTCGQVRKHISDAPLGTQRRRVPLRIIESGEPLSEIEHFVTNLVLRHHVSTLRAGSSAINSSRGGHRHHRWDEPRGTTRRCGRHHPAPGSSADPRLQSCRSDESETLSDRALQDAQRGA
jgi:hypothetical protein